MTKTTITAVIAIAIVAALVFFVFGKDVAHAPIVDPTCEPGYELVGEGCITHDEACKLQGDQYYFDEAAQECLTR